MNTNENDPLAMLAVAIANHLGIDPLTVVGMLPLIVIGLNILGRAIPDDATGWQGWVRKIAKVGGLYLSNRVASGISVNKVVAVAAGLKKVEEAPELAQSLVHAEPPALELGEVKTQLAPLFPKKDASNEG